MLTADAVPGVLSVPWGAWRQDSYRSFEFPPGWELFPLVMPAAPALADQQIAAALNQPIGAPPLGELAASAEKAAIAIDDITRPTPAAAVVGAIVGRLTAAGMREDRITIVVASGAHRQATAWDIERKIGPALSGRLRVVCHDPAAPLAETNVTLAGVPVRINREFHEADLRIGISAVMPHPFAAFSGGGKIVVPGLADLEVLTRTHKYALMGLSGGHELANNRFRRDMEAAVGSIGLHWTANVVVNAERRIAHVAAGDFVSAHRVSAGAAAELGRTAPPGQLLDALLLNAYPKDGELLQIEAALVALRSGMLRWLTPAAPIVLMASCVEGVGTHGLFGPGGRLFRTPAAKGFLAGRPLLIYSPGVDEAAVRSVFWNGYPFHTSWTGVLHELASLLPAAPRIGVVPCGPLQLAERITADEGTN